MVKNMHFEARQPSVQSMQNQNTTQTRRRSHRTSSALTLLLAVQACSLGTVVSARPGVIARSESGSFQTTSLSTSAIASSSASSSFVTPYQSNEAKLQYRQADDVSQEQSSISTSSSSYSAVSQPSVTAIARSIGGELPSVTVSSSDATMTTNTASTSTPDDSDAPVLLRQADPERSVSTTSTSIASQETRSATSSPAAVFAMEPTQTYPSSDPPNSTSMPTDDGKEVSESRGGGNEHSVRARDVNHNDDVDDDSAEYHDAESAGSASGDEGSSESCSEEEEGGQNRQEKMKVSPVSSTLDQLGTTIHLKRYSALYEAALVARSLSDFAEKVQSMEHSKRSWFDDALSTDPGIAAKKANKVQKDDGAIYSVMKRLLSSHEKQVDIHKRLVDLIANANVSSKRDHDNTVKTKVRRQDDPTMTTTTPSSSAETAFPTVSNAAAPNEEARRREEIGENASFRGKAKRTIHGQWDEHEHQCICTSTTTPSSPSATVSANPSRKRGDDQDDDQKRHQLLTSAMSDWSFVSGWLSSRLPVNLHKQVEQALQASSSSYSTVTDSDPSKQ